MVGLLCISWSAIFVKLANVSGFASAFYRMAIASVVVLPLWLSCKKSGLDAKAIKTAIVCGCFFACDIAMWNTSILLSKAAISTLLANLAPDARAALNAYAKGVNAYLSKRAGPLPPEFTSRPSPYNCHARPRTGASWPELTL